MDPDKPHIAIEKLVRDGIPALIQADGRAALLRQVDDLDVAPFIRRKVLEEAAEVYDALVGGDARQLTGELADLMEVARRAAALAGIPWAEVEAARERKAAERGAFDQNWILGGLPADLYRVYGGRGSPMHVALHQHLRTCRRASFAVSFSQASGVELLWESLAAALRDGAEIRILTSDYLDITDPEALEELVALPGRLDLRLYHEPGRSFHAKSYIFEDRSGRRAAFVGSSNLSRSALDQGVEWNYLARDTDDGWSITDLLGRFDALFDSPFARRVTPDVIADYRARRGARTWLAPDPDEAPGPTPNAPQREALAALAALRADGESRALVVAATGVGKTYLAAFDSAPHARVLFLAHREELLHQAMRSFASVRPGARVGIYGGGRHDLDADVLCASIATLGRPEHLARFAADRFDYIVVDEFHHAAATSYERVLAYFEPRFLLGLTATPYRGDNRDVFALCDGNVAYRLTFMEAIAFGWLSPFRYFGIYDATDYADVPWRNGRFDAEALGRLVATQVRADAVLRAFREHPSRAALGFCASIAHAEFMAARFTAAGVPALAVHSGAGSLPRAEALARLRSGEVAVLFAVDAFNEGVDVPELDLVMFLRPTDSVTVFLQQLGRGLRLHPEKRFLTVLDFLGNYRRAHYKLPLVLGRLSVDPEPGEVAAAIAAYGAGTLALPPGVTVHFDLRAIDLIREMTARADPRRTRLTGAYRELEAELGRRPTLLELHRRGRYEARAYVQEFGSWNAFLAGLPALSADERALDAQVGAFLADLERTKMTRSYKMVVLLDFVRLGGLVAPVPVDALVVGFQRYFLESPRHGRDLPGVETMSARALQSHLLRNPLAAWTRARANRPAWFRLVDDQLGYVGPAVERLDLFADAVRERAVYRLARYFDGRPAHDAADPRVQEGDG